jgi:hypothetical protein
VRMKRRKRKKRMLMMEEMPPHPLLLHHHLYHTLMRDYEEHPLWMEDDFDDLDDDPNDGRSDVDEWFPEGGSNDRD